LTMLLHLQFSIKKWAKNFVNTLFFKIIKKINTNIFVGEIIYNNKKASKKQANIQLQKHTRYFINENTAINVIDDNISIQETTAYYSAKNRFLFSASGELLYKCISAYRWHQVPKKILPEKKVFVYDKPILYVGDFEMAHYGHFLIEGISQLWAAIENFNDYNFFYLGKKITFKNYSQRVRLKYIDDFMKSLEIDRKQLLFSDMDIYFTKIYLPDPSFLIDKKASIEHRKVIKKSFDYYFSSKNFDRKGCAYLSRSRFKSRSRQILNEKQLEEKLKYYNVEIIFPESHSLQEQIRLFNSFESIIACFGSAIHTELFSFTPGLKMFVLTTEKTNLTTAKLIDELSCTKAEYITTVRNTSNSEPNDFCIDKYIDVNESIEQLKILGAI
jgi:hypothetical protein